MSKLILGFTPALLILFSMTIILNNSSVIFGQSESISSQMSAEQMGGGGGGKLISPLTEWIGIFSMGIVVGMLAFETNTLDNLRTFESKKIILSVAILSISVGAIHLLLVQEHAKESLWWGAIFLIAGIAQIGYGLILVFIKKPQTNNILYYIGLIGNAILFAIFILVRLIVPPFSPEGTPINELEPNGIITLVIEMLIVVMLTYIIKFKEVEKKVMR